MKYQVKRMTPEFKAINYSLAIVQIVLLYALFEEMIGVQQFVAAYVVLLIVHSVTDFQQRDIVDERKVNLD